MIKTNTKTLKSQWNRFDGMREKFVIVERATMHMPKINLKRTGRSVEQIERMIHNKYIKLKIYIFCENM